MAAFLDIKSRPGGEGSVLPAEVVDELRRFVFAGGKRVRPLLCLLGWFAVAGPEASAGLASGGRTADVPAPVVGVAASLELFHAFALIHDDVMDDSSHRRGLPTVHHALAVRHAEGRSTAQARHVGAAAAVLVGDLALSWSDELIHAAGLTPGRLAAVLPLVDVMRTEVMAGQYLDIAASGHLSADVERALQVARYKTAKYTCERPLHIGATLAGAGPGLLEACTAFAVPLGEAFQLRDDVLGVFGDSALTGKSTLEDLRDGKNTVLLALALRRADTAQLHDLQTLVATPALDGEGAGRVREILVATGALAETENMIRDRLEQARHALAVSCFPPYVTAALQVFTDSQRARTS
ncbi:polyprenyl synthetase family protein [Streptomyces sp. NPDC060028]|uniref:polyprenyl synthetase family protein n=1 Tax=Streptomyces sp. NPDC060028 TaxID=3347041 RepID=UPI003683818F